MLDTAVIATVFGLDFVGELPDKTAVAGLVLGTRFPWRWVFSGVAAAFATHVVIAVAAGSLLALLPRRPVEAIVAVLFLLGALLIWREGQHQNQDEQVEHDEVPAVPDTAGFWRVAGLGYAVIFVAEWGDLTQILTANLAAKYHDPLSVGIGALLALWAVGLLAILGGKTLLRYIPLRMDHPDRRRCHARARWLQHHRRRARLTRSSPGSQRRWVDRRANSFVETQPGTGTARGMTLRFGPTAMLIGRAG